MTPQELKNSILQLAIQGKLVEQRPEDGTAEELYQQIQEEKKRLIKEGKIKKEKPLPKISEDEVPFEIPESWKWVRLGEISIISGGFAFKSTNYTTDGVRVVRISDFNELGFVNDKIVRHPYDESLSSYVLEAKNILLCMTGGTVGKSLFVTEINEKMVVNQRVATIKVQMALPEYVYQVILAPVTQKVIQYSKNSTNDNISIDTIKDFLIPFPPLSEQKRIVSKIEELLPYIDRYEQAWNRLEEFNKRFPVDMQKSLLQWAIQGKLVEQRPEEGTAEELYRKIQEEKRRLVKEGKIKKEKPLPEIAEDEVPFEIPENWKWVRFGNVISLVSGTDFKPDEYNDQVRGTIYITGASSLSDNGVTISRWTEAPRNFAYRGDILLVCKGSGYGKTVFCDVDEAHIARQIMAIKQMNTLNMSFIRYFLQSNIYYLKAKGQGVIPGIDRASILNMFLPLPPLAEQKRIVAKLEELLPLCERLK